MSILLLQHMLIEQQTEQDELHIKETLMHHVGPMREARLSTKHRAISSAFHFHFITNQRCSEMQ